MDRLDSAELQRLRFSLPYLSEGHTFSDKDSVHRYLNYYGLDDMPAVSHLFGTLDVDGYTIVAHLWKPAIPRGTVFLGHGYYDHSGLYKHLIRFCLEQGFSVFIHDLPGHGLSSGEPASIQCFSDYSKVLQACLNWGLKQSLPEPWHLIGQSTGGAIITDMLVEYESQASGWPLTGIVLLAPLVRPVKWRQGVLQYFLLRYFIKSIPRSHSFNSNDPDFLDFLQRDPLQASTLPVVWVGALHRWIGKIEAVDRQLDFEPLVIQGQLDGTVDWRHNLNILKRLYKGTDISFLPEGRHQLANESSDIRAEYFKKIQVYLDSFDSKSSE